MAKEKQHVFSARTTDEGLRLLNQLKADKGISWDDLVIDAVCAHYGLEKATMALPKAKKPAKKGGTEEEVVAAAVDATGTDALSSEGASAPTGREARAGSGKATKRHNEQKGGKGRHGKEKAASQNTSEPTAGA